jgi:hypothetical protein
VEQQRWGVENRNHHALEVAQANAASVLGIFRHLSNAFKQGWAQGRPKRLATSLDWIERNASNSISFSR